jgi:PEGA domain-containing protein
MERCPSCGQSRWVYPRTVMLGPLAEWLTGLSPYECLSCGWRGWRHKRSTHHPFGSYISRLQPMLASAERVLDRLADIGVRRLAALRWFTARRMVRWLIPAFALGLTVGGLFFSGEESVAEPQTLVSADESTSSQPASPSVLSSETAVTPPPTPGLQAARTIESPRVVPTSGRSRAKAAAPPRQPGARAPVASKPALKAASASERSTAAGQPRFRGSLAIESDPPGAIVTVDGRVVGSTPVLLKDVPAGSCVVRVESNGYERWSAAVRVVANKETRVSATLQGGSRQ